MIHVRKQQIVDFDPFKFSRNNGITPRNGPSVYSVLYNLIYRRDPLTVSHDEWCRKQ